MNGTGRSLRLRANVISIRTYLQADRRTEEMLFRLVQLLIENVERHSMEGAPGELERVRESMQQVLVALRSRVPPEELMDKATLAMDMLKHHNQHVVDYLRRPVAELQAKVRLLTDAVTAVSSTSSENIRRLRDIKGRLIASSEVRDIRSLREHLSQCLDGVLAEAERQRAEGERAAEQLNRRVPRQKPAVAEEEGPAIDPATGLPSRVEAEEAIAQSCQDEASAFIVVMVVNHVHSLSQTLGAQFGDVILQRFATFVREQLPTVDQLFRWSGPAVVALIRRRSALDVRGVIQPMLLQRLTVRTTNPEMHLPISTRWTVLPLMASPRLLFHKMDTFAGLE